MAVEVVDGLQGDPVATWCLARRDLFRQDAVAAGAPEFPTPSAQVEHLDMRAAVTDRIDDLAPVAAIDESLVGAADVAVIVPGVGQSVAQGPRVNP